MTTDWRSRAIDLTTAEKSSGKDWKSRAIDVESASFDNGEEKEEETIVKNVKETLPQFTKEAAISTLGTYGDLLGLVGIKPDEERQRKKSEQEFEILQRMEQPGYKPTYADLYNLTDDPYAPEPIFPPTTEGLRTAAEAIGVPGEPQTPAGKAAARSGSLYGAGLAFGQVNPLPSLAAGTIGQASEELGADPLIQSGLEIATLLISGGKSGKPLSSSNKEVQKKIKDLRNLGYSEQDITLAINSGKKRIASLASKGKQTESAFESFSKNSDKIVDDILNSSILGAEQGTKKVHQLASDAYGEMIKDSSKIRIKDAKPFEDSIKRVYDHLQDTLGTNPEASGFLKRLESAKEAALNNPSGKQMVNFYKELGNMGKWTGRQERDRLISEVRNGIKDTFKAQGKEGQEFLTKFEQANAGIKKAYDAEDLMDLIGKTRSPEASNYKKLDKILSNSENMKLAEDVLGNTQAKNLKLISKTGSEISDFDKSWKKATKGLISKGAEGAFVFAFWKNVAEGNMEGAAKVALTYGGKRAGQKVLEKTLRDPKYQNLLIKGIHAIKSESPKLFNSANEAIRKYHQDNIQESS